MSDWLDDLMMLNSSATSYPIGSEDQLPQACVLVSVVRTRGSCPRETGTRMVVALATCHGTIGGGHLEYQAIDIARDLLLAAKPVAHIERFPLGARVGQCCGGEVNLSFEYIPAVRPAWVSSLRSIMNARQSAVMVTAIDSSGSTNASDDGEHKLIVTNQRCVGTLNDTAQHQQAYARAVELLSNKATIEPVRENGLLYELIRSTSSQMVIFGAGHVAKALVNVLCELPCCIRWIDSRASEFPDHIPANVHVVITDQPEGEVDDIPAGSHVVIMTHSHGLDHAICERTLRRDDLAWCGLIGSATKRRQFEKRLLTRGLSERALKNLTCPIGIDGISGKHPAQIAISVAAEILLVVQAQHSVAVPDHQAA